MFWSHLLGFFGAIFVGGVATRRDLIDFIDELFAKVDFFEIFSVFSEQFHEIFEVLFIREKAGFLDNSRDRIVTILIEHDLSEKLLLFVLNGLVLIEE